MKNSEESQEMSYVEFDHKNAFIKTICTGSSAELCIKPVLPSAGDVDIMYQHNCYMAILGSEMDIAFMVHQIHGMHENIECFSVTWDQLHPGYGYLFHVGVLKYSWDVDKYYEFGKRYVVGYLNNKVYYRLHSGQKTGGPALKVHTSFPEIAESLQDSVISESGNVCLKIDYVMSIRCFSWPTRCRIGRTEEEPSAGLPCQPSKRSSDKAVTSFLSHPGIAKRIIFFGECRFQERKSFC